jgi:hypothetical protein
MKKIHLIGRIAFTESRMLMTIDGKRYSWELEQISDRLAHASRPERECYEISPAAYGIHWPLVDEDLSIDGLLRAAEREDTVTFAKSSPRRTLAVAEDRVPYNAGIPNRGRKRE